MKTATITAAGRQLEARYLTGEPGYPVLVLLHEALGSVALWKEIPEELVRCTGCPVLAYSRYGNGFSDVLQEARSAHYLHDEALSALPEVLAAFDVQDAVLVGHSDGASIALIYAGHAGSCVRGVVAEAPHVFVEHLTIESMARAKFVYESGTLRERLSRYHENVDRTFYGWNDIWLDESFRGWDIRGVLGAISIPVLLIQGTNDEYATLSQIEAIRAGASAARADALILSHCGHTPHRERPATVLDAIASFVRELRPQGR